ncbi:MAG TPA: hypothetical protein VK387_08360, partial [Thermoleophilaceae bacterium]|nr:hypothetical protein [Thermoleophilaceae bacterium]
MPSSSIDTPRETRRRAAPNTTARPRGHLSPESPLLGGPLAAEAGAEEPRPRPAPYDPRADVLALPRSGTSSHALGRRTAAAS